MPRRFRPCATLLVAALSALAGPVRADAGPVGAAELTEPPAGEVPSLPPAPEHTLLATLEEADGRVIAAIDVQTRSRLKPHALLRQLALRPGSRFDSGTWRRDLQQVRNLGFIDRLETRALLLPDGRVRLVIEAETNWSILPILGYQSGSLDMLLLGLYDANLLGEIVNLGGSYLRRDQYDLVRSWLVLPNLVSYGTQLELAVVMTGNTLALYPSDPRTPPAGVEPGRYSPDELSWRVPQQGYEILRRGAYAELGWQVLPGVLTASLRYLLLWETVNELPNLPAVVDRENRELPAPGLERRLHRKNLLSLPALNLQLGRVNLVDNYLFRGHQLRAVVVPSSSLLGSERELCWVYVDQRGFYHLGGPLELAFQTGFGYSTSTDPLDGLTLGGDNMDPFVYDQVFPGLLNIRGLRSTQLHGQQIAFANVELRGTLASNLPLWVLGRGAVQLAAFLDAGRAWDGPLLDAPDGTDDLGLAAGGGLLFTLRDIRFAFLNVYAAHTFSPLPVDVAYVVLTRPFF